MARLRPGFVVDKAAVVARPPGSLLLDARAAERYRGEAEPIDPRAGHIPGAKSAPYAANLTTEAIPRFRPARGAACAGTTLSGRATEEPVVYCGSGITACHDLLALHLAGLQRKALRGLLERVERRSRSAGGHRDPSSGSFPGQNR